MSQPGNEVPGSAGIWKEAFRNSFASRPFVVAVVIMAVAAFGMGAATSFMKLRFRKTPVELRQPLEKVPTQLGRWIQVSSDEPLPEDIEQTLGTKRYIFRDYADTNLVGPQKIKELLDADRTDRRRLLTVAEGQMPRGYVHLAVTYYTGMVDTVAHVPDRCYIADGYAPQDPETREWKMADGESLSVRYISFEDATGFSSRVTKNVAYLFQVNGEMASSPTAVRVRLQDLTRADVYYAKVELMSLWRNRNEAEAIMKDFLKEALPEIRRCLPARVVEAPATQESQQ